MTFLDLGALAAYTVIPIGIGYLWGYQVGYHRGYSEERQKMHLLEYMHYKALQQEKAHS